MLNELNRVLGPAGETMLTAYEVEPKAGWLNTLIARSYRKLLAKIVARADSPRIVDECVTRDRPVPAELLRFRAV